MAKMATHAIQFDQIIIIAFHRIFLVWKEIKLLKIWKNHNFNRKTLVNWANHHYPQPSTTSTTPRRIRPNQFHVKNNHKLEIFIKWEMDRGNTNQKYIEEGEISRRLNKSNNKKDMRTDSSIFRQSIWNVWDSPLDIIIAYYDMLHIIPINPSPNK